MKERAKGFISGLIIGSVLIPSAIYATTGTVQKNLQYNNIKISLDNKEVKPTDANGTYVEPFIIDGTTYLPVRGVANALGLGVEWDGATNTVKLSTAKSGQAQGGGNVVVDHGGIKITYKGYEFDKDLKLNFLIENNSQEPICVQVRDESVNGFMTSAIFSEEVQVGKKSNATVKIPSYSLDDIDVTEMETAEFTFHIFNDDTWDTIFDTETIKITPQGASSASSQGSSSGSAAAQVNKGKGSVKGLVTYQYNDFVGTRGDNGATVMLIPKNDKVKTFDNASAALGVTGDYKSGILVKKCDGYGNFAFGNEVPAGDYKVLIISKNTTSASAFNDNDAWKQEIRDEYGDYFSDKDMDNLILGIGYHKYSTGDITVKDGYENTLSQDFGNTYV